MKDRIKKLRKELDLTQQEFANKLGVSRNNIASYETGKSNLGDTATSLICKTFNVNETWLREGTGEMFIQQTQDEQIAAFVGNILKDEEDSFKRRLISALCALDDDGWKILEKFIDSLPTKKG